MPQSDDGHLDLHGQIEDDIRSILSGIFEDPMCRLNVLLNLFYAEFMLLDSADDVAELVDDLGDILLNRAANDLTLFNHKGSA